MIETLQLREWLNEILVPLTFCLLVITAHSLWAVRIAYGPKKWRDVVGVGSACALWWLFFTEMIRAFNAWMGIGQELQGGYHVVASKVSMAVYLAISVVAVVATFRLVYALSPPAWGHRAWLAALAFVALFVVAAELLGY